jgi:hypothetical protein
MTVWVAPEPEDIDELSEEPLLVVVLGGVYMEGGLP